MARNNNSPGVLITEKDLSLRLQNTTGTQIFVPGFAAQGPVSEPLMISTVSELEQIYGVPTTAAERYFYYSCREVLNSPSVLNTIRLPYGENNGSAYANSYSGLFYPAISAADGYGWQIGAPTYLPLSETQHAKIVQGDFDWTDPTSLDVATPYISYSTVLSSVTYSMQASATGLAFALANDTDGQNIDISTVTSYNTSTSSVEVSAVFTFGVLTSSVSYYTNTVVSDTLSSIGAGIVILNELQTVINEISEGYYVGLVDNASTRPEALTFDSIKSIATLTSSTKVVSGAFTPLFADRLDFALSASKINSDRGNTSISESLEKVGFIDFNLSAYQDYLSFGVFKIRKSTADASLLTVASTEKYIGSLNSNRKQVSPTGGVLSNAFLEDVVNNASSTVKMLINPAISRNYEWTENSSLPAKRVTIREEAKSLYPVGVFVPDTRAIESTKVIGSVPQKLDKALRSIENTENIIVDVLVDAGLSTIYSVTEFAQTGAFNDEYSIPDVSAVREAWASVVDILINFSQNTRKDCFTIIDPPRSVFVLGKDTKVGSAPNKTFTSDIYNPLKSCTSGLDSNYAAIYANWVKNVDLFTGKKVWLPFSGYAAAVFGRNDTAANAWSAPAGLNRGNFGNAVDIAFNPNQKQRDRLYEIAVNPVVFFNGDGYAIFGQKTIQTKPTSFDRINVRRLFLSLERSVQRTVKYFVFEPNTTFTRKRLVDTIAPAFNYAKNTQGLYDYLIVADERNNTPDTIDNNELIVDIYLKPVRAAEFILVNFVATRTSQNFQELI